MKDIIVTTQFKHFAGSAGQWATTPAGPPSTRVRGKYWEVGKYGTLRIRGKKNEDGQRKIVATFAAGEWISARFA